MGNYINVRGVNSRGSFVLPALNERRAVRVSVDSPLTAFGEVSAVSDTVQAQVDFVYALHSQMVNSFTDNGGTAEQSGGMAVVSTTTNSAGSARVSTRRLLKYRPGQGAVYRIAGIFTTGVSGSTQRLGGFDDDNGVGFGFDGDKFGVFVTRDGSTAWVYQDDWSVDALDGSGPSGMTIDPTKGNVYQIKYGYLGFAGPSFFVYDGAVANWVLCHTSGYTNKNTVPFLRNPSFPVSMEAKNDGNTSNLQVSCGSMYAAIEGNVSPVGPEYSRQWAISGTVGTTETAVVAIRGASTFASITSRIVVYPLILSFSNGSANKPQTIRVRRDSTFTTPTWSAVSAGSAVEYLSAGTANADGEVQHAFALGSGDSKDVDLSLLRLAISPSDTIVITVQASSGTNGDSSGSLSWIEDQ